MLATLPANVKVVLLQKYDVSPKFLLSLVSESCIVYAGVLRPNSMASALSKVGYNRAL